MAKNSKSNSNSDSDTDSDSKRLPNRMIALKPETSFWLYWSRYLAAKSVGTITKDYSPFINIRLNGKL